MIFLLTTGNAKINLSKQNEADIHPSINAEVKMALMLVHHNTFFNLSDHMTQYIRQEFKGSKAAQSFSCGRTKTAAIINCIGNYLQEELIGDMKTNPFSLMVDGSNDAGLEKMFPISVRIFDINFGKVMTKFFDMNMLAGHNSSTAVFMFNSIDNQLEKNGIPWNMVSVIGCSHVGSHNSIKTRALQKKSGYCYCWLPLSCVA